MTFNRARALGSVQNSDPKFSEVGGRVETCLHLCLNYYSRYKMVVKKINGEIESCRGVLNILVELLFSLYWYGRGLKVFGVIVFYHPFEAI